MVVAAVCAAVALPANLHAQDHDAEPIHPKHVTAEMHAAVRKGLDYLKQNQARDGSWSGSRDGAHYPCAMTSLAGMAFLAHGNTPTRGPYAEQIRGAIDYLITCSGPDGLITSSHRDRGQPMHGHGFALMFLASVYGMETRPAVQRDLKRVIEAGIKLTGGAQSPLGGWTYNPGGGDEGSVTVTQVQALRACRMAGFTVPDGVVNEAVGYLEKCQTPEGGIRYSFQSNNSPKLPISAAAVATLYNAGDYDSDMAARCMQYVRTQFKQRANQWNKGGGHAYYAHLYASQAFYQAGDDVFTEYFPGAAKQLLASRAADGSWNGDGVGPVYGTAIALTILQLPYKYVPIYQR